MEIIASPEQIFRPMLAYAKQTILPKSNNRISTVAKHIADLLFGNPSSIIKQEREERIHKFLNIAIFRLVKSKWADDKLARLVISIAILAKGGAEQDEMTASAQSMIVNSVKRAIQTWSDPVFIKHGSSGEKYCKFYVIPDEDYIRTEKKKKSIDMTAIILTLIAYMSAPDIQISIMMETNLLNSVSQYFASGDIPTAQIGAVMAEAISIKIDKEKPLNTTLLDSQDNLIQLKGLVFLKDALDKDVIADLSSEAENNESKKRILMRMMMMN